MPPKKKRAPPKKRKYTQKQKQKQKQKQSVNVKVSTSSGGSGGGTSFIPMPQAPAIDYAMLSQYLRPPNTVDAPIAAKSPEISAARTKIAERLAMRKPEDLMPQVRATEQASMGPLQGGISSAPIRESIGSLQGGISSAPIRESIGPLQGGMSSSSSRGKSVNFVGESLFRTPSSVPSDSESDVPYRTSKSKSSQYYRSKGLIPPESIGKGKRTEYEEDIYGIPRPKTSDIRGFSSFEPIGGGAPKSNVRYASDYLFSPSGGDTSDTGMRAAATRMAFAE